MTSPLASLLLIGLLQLSVCPDGFANCPCAPNQRTGNELRPLAPNETDSRTLILQTRTHARTRVRFTRTTVQLSVTVRTHGISEGMEATYGHGQLHGQSRTVRTVGIPSLTTAYPLERPMAENLPVPSDLEARLLKVLRLAEEGVGGARDNAQVMLDKLLKQHGLTMADLLDRSSDRERVWLAYADEQEMTVLHGLARSVLGAGVQAWCAEGELVLGFDVTRSQRAELEVAWDTYRSAWHRARHDVLIAFCAKHRLFDEREAAGHIPSTPDEYVDAYRRRHLMRGLAHVDAPRKRITGGRS